MVDWFLSLDDSELKVSSGNIIMAAPCLLNNQKDMITELQSRSPRMRILDEDRKVLKSQTPILVVKHLLNLNAKELKTYFSWWCREFKLDLQEEDALAKLIPKTDIQWNELKVEKRIALFLGCAIKTNTFSYAFFEDLHLEHNSQIFLFNFLKNITNTSSNQVIIFWSYRVQLPDCVPFYFKGFKDNAA